MPPSGTWPLVRVTAGADETEDLAAEVARGLPRGATVLLFGDLGAGKTAFARGLARGLGIDPDEVSSPTFTIVQSYAGPRVLHHVDLYRLEPGFDVDELDLGELTAEGVLVVEWAERWQAPPANAIAVRIVALDDDRREITIGPP